MSLHNVAKGSEAWEVVVALSQYHSQRVKTMTFICYRPIQSILERLGSENVREIQAVFQEATNIRDARVDGRHFFEIALSLAVSRGVGEQVIGEMLKEPDPRTRVRETIDIDGSSLPKRLKRESAVKTRGDVFAVASKCLLIDGTEAHIPMMDFRIKPNPESEAAVVTAMRSILPSGGAVLQSKNSYHFYGTVLLDLHGWCDFLGKSLLFLGLIDDRYIGHRLREGFGVLRISPGPFHQEAPFVVRTW